MGPRALTASSGFAPWSWLWIGHFGSEEKNPTVMGSMRGLPPHAASPFGGERGSPSQFPCQLKKLKRDFYRAIKTYCFLWASPLFMQGEQKKKKMKRTQKKMLWKKYYSEETVA